MLLHSEIRAAGKENSIDLESTALFDKIYAAMLGGAIGDAMGGPLEGLGLEYPEIVEKYGVVDDFLHYESDPQFDYQYNNEAGTITDDTRLKHILCQAIINHAGLPSRGDFIQACVDEYYAADTHLNKGFLEEYVLGGIHGESKLIWGGRMTNGGIMMNSPLGLICPCDPETAFGLSYDVDFISDGYAKYTTAIGAAAVSAAMKPDASPLSIVEDCIEACNAHMIVGKITREEWRWYENVFEINQNQIRIAVDIASHHMDVFSVREEYYKELKIDRFGAEPLETLCVALGMLVAAEGEFRKTIIGCVNYGRDCDSMATLGGAIAGALNGTEGIPEDWQNDVETANPIPDIRSLSEKLASIALKQLKKREEVLVNVNKLISASGT